ncbi:MULTISPECIES: hypothetical protein [unclassified Streptomyces]|uniref:hypothetical protein n=1 Tax=unclassified Streptomyces TaxID=2593676 RepID=UPI000DC79ED1|nr:MULTISPECIES: hypothetical protein [unclassified Streptomyces]AWZ05693.1 hypothetical protein DRB89_14685 [Streptomyces sp. ICC4]AWZ11942.1 hypothetical protein DRB96_06010 [Streptomyces sp. ICC1]
MINDSLQGEELAEMLTRGMRNDHVKAAIRLLGADRDGYWLRRLLDDEELNAASDVPLIDRSGRPPLVEWDALERLLARNPGVFAGSDTAVLTVALSLVGPWKRSSTSMPRDGVVRRGFGDASLPQPPAPGKGRQRNPKRYTGPGLPLSGR